MKKELKEYTTEDLSKLQPRHEKIFRWKVHEGKTFGEIAAEFDLTRARVHQLYHKALVCLGYEKK